MLLSTIFQWHRTTFWKGSIIVNDEPLSEFGVFWVLCCGWCITGSLRGLFLLLSPVVHQGHHVLCGP